MGKIISQMKQAETSLNEEFKPFQKEKTEYHDRYKQKKEVQVGEPISWKRYDSEK